MATSPRIPLLWSPRWTLKPLQSGLCSCRLLAQQGVLRHRPCEASSKDLHCGVRGKHAEAEQRTDGVR